MDDKVLALKGLNVSTESLEGPKWIQKSASFIFCEVCSSFLCPCLDIQFQQVSRSAICAIYVSWSALLGKFQKLKCCWFANLFLTAVFLSSLPISQSHPYSLLLAPLPVLLSRQNFLVSFVFTASISTSTFCSVPYSHCQDHQNPPPWGDPLVHSEKWLQQHSVLTLPYLPLSPSITPAIQMHSSHLVSVSLSWTFLILFLRFSCGTPHSRPTLNSAR